MNFTYNAVERLMYLYMKNFMSLNRYSVSLSFILNEEKFYTNGIILSILSSAFKTVRVLVNLYEMKEFRSIYLNVVRKMVGNLPNSRIFEENITVLLLLQLK